VQTSELSANDRAVGQDGSADVVADASPATPPMRTATVEAGRVLLGYVGMDGQPEKGQVALLRDGANFIAHGPNGDYALDDARTPEQARQRVQQLLRHDAISDRYPMQARDALTPGEKAQSKQGLADELTRFESQVNRFASEYGERAEGKAGIQKAMDFGRQIFNSGYGDDQFKNIGQTQEGLKQLRADVQAGRLDAGQVQQQLQALKQNFEAAASKVDKAQAHNAEIGQLVHDTTRAVVVGGAGFLAGGAGFAAGMGVGSVPGAVVAGAAGATAAANAFDAVSKGAQEFDKKLGNGAQDGQPGFAPELNTKGSLAGLASNALAGEHISGKDVLNTAVTSTLDAAGGAWAGKIVHSTQGAFAAAHVTAQQAARQSGLSAAQSATVQATNTTLAGEAAKVSATHAVGQSGTELLIKNAGTMADPSLNAQQRNEQVLANTKDSALQLPGRVVFGAAGSAAAGIKPANMLADAATQWGISSTAAAGQTFVGNGLTGQGWQLDDKDVVQASLFGVFSTVRNYSLRTPTGTREQRPVSQTGDTPRPALPHANSKQPPTGGDNPQACLGPFTSPPQMQIDVKPPVFALPPADIRTIGALPGTTERMPPSIDFPRSQDVGALQSFPGAGVYVEADWRGEATAHVPGALLARAGREYAGPIVVTARGPSMQADKLIDYLGRTFPNAAVALHTPPKQVTQEMVDASSARNAHSVYRDWADGMVRYRLSPSNHDERLHDFVNATFVLADEARRDPQVRDRVSLGMSAGIAPSERRRILKYLDAKDAAHGLLDANRGKVLIHVRNDPRDAGSSRNLSAELMNQLASGARERGLIPVIFGDEVAATPLPPDAVDLTRFFDHLPGYAEQALMFKTVAAHSRGAIHIGMMSGAIDFAYLAGGAAASSIQLGPDNRLGAWRDAFGESSYGLVALGAKGGSQLYPTDHYDAGATDEDRRKLSPSAWQDFQRLLDMQVRQYDRQ
jgi:hypothetical protein